MLQEFYFIPLDIFFRLKDNKKKTIRNEVEAWLYFIESDKPEDIRRVIQKFPKFEEMYREASVFRYHPEEAVEMFSDALRKLDENTVNYMIEMLKYHPEEAEEMFSDALRKLDENTINYMIEILKEELLKMGSVLEEKEA